MMKRNSKRFLTLLCVSALVLSFASCTNTANDAAQTTGGELAVPSAQADNTAPQTQAVPVSGSVPAASNGQTPSGSAGTTGKNENKTPSQGGTQALNKAQVIALYNQSIRASAPKRTRLERTMEKGALWVPGKFDGATFDLVKEQASKDAFNLSSTSSAACDLPQLQESWVASATCKTSGGKRILTIKLKDLSVGNSLQNGAGGYINLVNFTQGKKLAKEIGQSINSAFSVISVKNIANTLSGGTITATLPAGTDTAQSVTFTYKQRMDMNMKYLTMDVKGDITAQFQMSYGA